MYYNLCIMSVNGINHSTPPPARPPRGRKAPSWSLFKLVKAAVVGILLLTGGVSAGSQNLCEHPNMRELCRGNWGIPRNQMPQVVGEARSRYLKEKSDAGFKVWSERVPSHKLISIQNEINRDIVFNMMKNPEFKPCDQSILVANETIIDGHHTLTACKLRNEGPQEAAIIEDDPHRVLRELQDFPGVTRLNLDDSVRN